MGVVVIMVGILFSLVRAGVLLMRGGSNSGGTLMALKWRILLSVVLFSALFVAFSMGYIQPHGL